MHHSSSIGLIRNLDTEHVSPQWHVVYDERFTTVTAAEPDDDDLGKIWIRLFHESRDYYVDRHARLIVLYLDYPWRTGARGVDPR